MISETPPSFSKMVYQNNMEELKPFLQIFKDGMKVEVSRRQAVKFKDLMSL
jgi:hypothetical protein